VTPNKGPVSLGVQGKPESFINTLEADPTLTHSSLTPDTVNHDIYFLTGWKTGWGSLG